MPSKHHLLAGVVIAGAGYELYQDYTGGGTTIDYVIDASLFIAGVMLFF